MSTDPSLGLAFAAGIGGILHCLGMCPGIAGGLFVCRGGGWQRIVQYHATRILVYVLIGAAGGALGRVLLQQGLLGKVQGLVMMAAGVVVIALGVWHGRFALGPRGVDAGGVLPVAIGTRRGAPRGLTAWQAMTAGAVNGLVPCALTTSVAIQGAAIADPVRAAALMLAFGVGTLPTMVLVSLGGSVVARRGRGIWAGLAGLAVVLMGLWTIYEGWIFFDVMRGLGNW